MLPLWYGCWISDIFRGWLDIMQIEQLKMSWVLIKIPLRFNFIAKLMIGWIKGTDIGPTFPQVCSFTH